MLFIFALIFNFNLVSSFLMMFRKGLHETNLVIVSNIHQGFYTNSDHSFGVIVLNWQNKASCFYSMSGCKIQPKTGQFMFTIIPPPPAPFFLTCLLSLSFQCCGRTMRKQLDKNLSFHKLVAYMIALMTGELMQALQSSTFV